MEAIRPGLERRSRRGGRGRGVAIALAEAVMRAALGTPNHLSVRDVRTRMTVARRRRNRRLSRNHEDRAPAGGTA